MKLTQSEAKQQAKTMLKSYLQGKGIDPHKPFRCLSPRHPDKHPSMSFSYKTNRVKCWSCQFGGDIFTLVGEEYGLYGKAMFEKTYELLGLEVEGVGKKTASAAQQMQRTTLKKENPESAVQEPAKDFTGYYQRCAERTAQTDYFARRGLDADTVRRFRLGYDPACRCSTRNTPWKAIIIPTAEDSYVIRNTSLSADEKNRYRKVGHSRIFNLEALNGKGPVFIVEGEIDALSLESVGMNAVALGSVANAGAFLREVEQRLPELSMVIAMDSDKAGVRTADELAEGLKKLGMNFLKADGADLFLGEKDANAALVKDREAFSRTVHGFFRAQESAAKAVEYEEYQRNSAFSFLDDFMNGIAESVDTPLIRTGFRSMDSVFDGGMREGLYIIGAVSSLGKTTFCQQIADQVAASGEDVLYFSLEMSKHELASKSISRETMKEALEKKLDPMDARTARQITTAAFYDGYTSQQLMLIDRAVERYSKYAPKLYYFEGVGDIGVSQIRETIEKHIRIMGRKPGLVLVDYLQILAPYSDRASDKQNVDRAVLELKRISRDFKCPVWAISSLNRSSYTSKIEMSAMKESGSIEFSSDVLMGLQPEGIGMDGFDMNEAKAANPRKLELVILKNRNGRTGLTIGFSYYPAFNFFKER